MSEKSLVSALTTGVLRLSEGALENVKDIYLWPYGNVFDTMLNIL